MTDQTAINGFISEALAQNAGESVATVAIVLGLLRAIRNVPSVREAGLYSFEHAYAAQLNVLQPPTFLAQFEAVKALAETALTPDAQGPAAEA